MIKHYFDLLRRWFWLLTLTTLIAGAISFLVSKRQPVYYMASSRLLVGTATSSPNVDLNDLRAAGQLLEIYAEVTTTRPFLESVLKELGPVGMSASELENRLSVSTNSSTDILTLRFEAQDPDRAVAIVNAIAGGLVRQSPSGAGDTGTADQLQGQIQRVEQMIVTSQTTISQLESEMQSASTYDQQTQLAGQLSAERTRLSDAERLLISLYTTMLHTPNNQIAIIEPAVQGHAVSRETPLKTVLGVMAGLILGAAIMFAFEYSDDTIRTREDLAAVADVPVLASLHTYGKLTDTDGADLLVLREANSRMAESYRRLGTELLFTGKDHRLRSVLIAGLQDNKDPNEVAANLATVLAQLDRRVVLVDTDLRNSTVSQLFGLTGQPGLIDLLQGEAEPSRLITSIADIPGLSVLPVGRGNGTFTEGLASHAMPDLVDYLHSVADMVVFVAPALLAYADGLVLAPRVDSVLIVSVSGISRRQQVRDAVETLHTVGVRVGGMLLVRRSAKRRHVLPSRKDSVILPEEGRQPTGNLAGSEASQEGVG
jgi:capsular polysaccharide biosynthesis protein/Mrp family chromosome partitioning ATPase